MEGKVSLYENDVGALYHKLATPALPALPA